MKQGFRQGSAGEITLPVVAGSNHCSIGEETVRIRWEIEFFFDMEARDGRGFLFHAYWEAVALTPLAISCEDLCYATGDAFVRMMGDRARYIQKYRIAIYPFGQTFAEHWVER